MAFLSILMKNLLKGPSTEPLPTADSPTPAAYRGKVTFDETACVGCKMCEHVCPGGAIRFDERPEGLRFMIWHNTCVNCGLCAHYCLTKAIKLSNDWHLSHLQEDKYRLTDQALVAYAACSGCGTKMLPTADALMRLAYKKVSPRSEHLRHLCPDCRRSASVSGDIQ
ncbi:4Fe-4S ferredoxin [Rhodospirillum rubrum]|uniref:4Fe-4S binding protein n=1 Tax=Rhodospirillum rubrum TaxID=1085 RepID=UPI00190370A6|nr:4Fe-4S binding protein [Rhodospirillum rubrum]MBK1662906.1 4Fe-4S ferredoxin [Rhodospirillum rubrum]MBK1677092.1 4Fe-4S ferredoxin [Rhodospirillum rubrum]